MKLIRNALHRLLLYALPLVCLTALHTAKAFPAAAASTRQSPWVATTTTTRGGSHPPLVKNRCGVSTTTTTNKVTKTTTLAASSNLQPATTDEGFTREQQVELSTGVSMLVLSSLPPKQQRHANNKNKPTLLFLHGSFHGAWCWAENFFPYFTQLGYPVVALSWRGTGGTFAGEGVKKVKIMEHVADLESVLDQLESIVELPSAKRPVLIAHSFGSLAVMKGLEAHPKRARELAGIAILCGVPPSGNGKLTSRTLRRSLVDSWKITVGFAMKRCTKKADLCRDLFFGGPVLENDQDGTVDNHGISDDDVARYQTYFARDSEATIDLLDLAKILPSAAAIEGVAPFVNELPPALVLGATRDFIVDEEGNQETAIYFGLDQPIMVDSPHDVMLGSQWRQAADVLAEWLEGLEASS